MEYGQLFGESNKMEQQQIKQFCSKSKQAAKFVRNSPRAKELTNAIVELSVICTW